MRSQSSAFFTDAARSMSTFASLNSVDSDWTRPAVAALSWATPASAATSASPEASITDIGLDPALAPLVPQADGVDAAILDARPGGPGVEQQVDARISRELAPTAP